MKLQGLKFIRKTFALTMKELSEGIGVSSNTINLWEKCSLDVTEERLDQLCDFFGFKNREILLYDFSKDDKKTSKMILAVETARLEYKIKEYNSNYIDNFKPDNMNELNLLESNRELYDNLNLGVSCLAEELKESVFKEVGNILEEFIYFVLDEENGKNNIEEFKLWYNIMTFDINNKYGHNTNINEYSVEDYLKLEIIENFRKLKDIEYKRNRINDDKETYTLSDYFREY